MDRVMLGGTLAVVVLLVPICTGYNFTSYETFSGSIWNDYSPDRALKNDAASCYMGGREEASFWKVKIPDTVTVNRVVISGEYVGDLMVRVGFDHSDVNTMEGHESNLPCRQLGVNGIFNQQVFECSKERSGNVISINGVTPESNNMVICDVKLE